MCWYYLVYWVLSRVKSLHATRILMFLERALQSVRANSYLVTFDTLAKFKKVELIVRFARFRC
jgi:hypothetical protein